MTTHRKPRIRISCDGSGMLYYPSVFLGKPWHTPVFVTLAQLEFYGGIMPTVRVYLALGQRNIANNIMRAVSL